VSVNMSCRRDCFSFF